MQKASTQFLGLGQGHLSDQHHFKSICDEHTKVQRYQIIIITISLTLQYRINDVDSKIKWQARLNSPLGVERIILDGALGNRRLLIVIKLKSLEPWSLQKGACLSVRALSCEKSIW